MASAVMRVKWLVVRRFSQNKAEVLALLFLVGAASVFVSYLWAATRPMDGTFIDLSEKHQLELLEDFRQSQAQKQELLHQQRAIDQVEGGSDIRHLESLLNDHVPYPRDFKADSSTELNLTKHKTENRLLGGDPPAAKLKRRQQLIGKKTHEEFVKYYDPSIGKIIMKPVIKEESDLHGGQGHCTVYDLTSNVTSDWDCVTLSIRPRTHVCLYPDAQDIHISRHIRQEGIWEPHIIKDYQNILYGDPDLAVIDIGANIGLYTLLAARMGHKVIAIEPLPENIKRLQRAAQMDGTTDKITVLQNAVSDQRLNYYLNLQPENQGGISLQASPPDAGCVAADCRPPRVQGIYMDDLLEITTFTKAVLKIDIEGHEHRAFLHSGKLMDKVYIPFIFMEWMKLRSYHGSEITQSEDKDLTRQLVTVLVARGYQPYSSVTMERLNVDWWVAWTDDIIWKHDMREFN